MPIRPAFPRDMQGMFNRIEDEVVWLHGKSIIFRQLYGTSKERVDLLNKSASTFFRVVHDSLLSDIVLSVNRLADPPQSVGKDNLSFAQLILQFDSRNDAQLISSLDKKLDGLKAMSEP